MQALTRENLEAQTKRQLRQLCEDGGFAGFQQVEHKAGLVDHILRWQQEQRDGGGSGGGGGVSSGAGAEASLQAAAGREGLMWEGAAAAKAASKHRDVFGGFAALGDGQDRENDDWLIASRAGPLLPADEGAAAAGSSGGGSGGDAHSATAAALLADGQPDDPISFAAGGGAAATECDDKDFPDAAESASVASVPAPAALPMLSFVGDEVCGTAAAAAAEQEREEREEDHEEHVRWRGRHSRERAATAEDACWCEQGGLATRSAGGVGRGLSPTREGDEAAAPRRVTVAGTIGDLDREASVHRHRHHHRHHSHYSSRHHHSGGSGSEPGTPGRSGRHRDHSSAGSQQSHSHSHSHQQRSPSRKGSSRGGQSPVPSGNHHRMQRSGAGQASGAASRWAFGWARLTDLQSVNCMRKLNSHLLPIF
jgi:hypothetical protein